MLTHYRNQFQSERLKMWFWQDRDGDNCNVFLKDRDNQFTFAQVFDAGDQIFDAIESGLVLIIMGRDVECVCAYFGALRKDLVPLLLSPEVTEENLARYLNAYKPDYMIAPVDFSIGGYSKLRKLERFCLYHRNTKSNLEIHSDLGLMLTTSGSTGDPKCVRLSKKNIQSCTEAIVEYLDMDQERVGISTLPLYYSYGLSTLHNATFSRSKYVLTDASVTDRDLWEFIRANKVTDFQGVPSTFEILKQMRAKIDLFETVKYVTQAGGALKKETAKHFIEFFTENSKNFFIMYGQTEASPRISFLPPQKACEKLGSVGVPIRGGRVTLRDCGLGKNQGELIYLGPNVALGYAERRGDLRLGDEFDGRLPTGDLAGIDKDGFIKIIGRISRFVKVHGQRVNLDDIENTFGNAGLDAVVVGRDEKICVCVLSDSEVAANDLIRTKFRFHPSTRKVVVVDEFPIKNTGKLDYKKLAESVM